MKPFELALLMQGAGDWIGGMEYIRNLGRAIHTVAAEKDPGTVRLTIFTGHKLTGEWADAFESLGAVVQLPLRRSLPERILGLGNRGFAKQIARRNIDFFYPLGIENRFNVGVSFPLPARLEHRRWAGWIPDFQHKHLPHYFSANELRSRDRGTEMLARHARTIVFSSHSAAADFNRFWPEARVKVEVLQFATAPLPAWYAPDPLAVQEAYGLPDRFFLVSNQFWQHKNHRLLFEALGILARSGVRPRIVCTGSPEDYRAPRYYPGLLQYLEETGCAAQVSLLGVVPRLDQLQLMRRSLAVLQPSLFEGWSTVVEDARLLGKRVVASDIPVHVEQNPVGCRFFARQSAEALAQVLQEWWQDLQPGPDLWEEEQARIRADQAMRDFGRCFLRIAGAPGWGEAP